MYGLRPVDPNSPTPDLLEGGNLRGFRQQATVS